MGVIEHRVCQTCGALDPIEHGSHFDARLPPGRDTCYGKRFERVEYVPVSELRGAVERAEAAERLVALYRENGSADLTRLVEYEAEIAARGGQ